MTTLSITLPDRLAKASQEAAQQLGVSRSQFIRQAIARELEQFREQQERKAIIESFRAMKRVKGYQEEAQKITERLNADLPEEENMWWNPSNS